MLFISVLLRPVQMSGPDQRVCPLLSTLGQTVKLPDHPMSEIARLCLVARASAVIQSHVPISSLYSSTFASNGFSAVFILQYSRISCSWLLKFPNYCEASINLLFSQSLHLYTKSNYHATQFSKCHAYIYSPHSAMPASS